MQPRPEEQNSDSDLVKHRCDRSNNYDVYIDLLKAIASLSSVLLIDDNLERGIGKALKILGESIKADRLILHQHDDDTIAATFGYIAAQYQETSNDTASLIHHSQLNCISDRGIVDCYSSLMAGKHCGGAIDDLVQPLRDRKLQLGVKATYAIPIMLKGGYWGVITLDFCRVARLLEEAEIEILKTAAACIGGAIERERNRCAREEAEKAILLEREKAALEQTVNLLQNNRTLTLRDKCLEATANAANKLLQITDLDRGMNAALKILGESLNCDRVNIMQQLNDGTQEFARTIYEWHSPHAISQLSHPTLNQISARGIEDWLITLKAGGWVGGTIGELKEPFRGGQIELGVEATYSVPIFINRVYWGAICIDYCRQAKRLTTAEISVFKTAASCIGSAIYRQQIQRDKDRAELTVLNERNRMAREIHDTLAQAFTGISLQLEAARSILSTQPEVAQLRLLQAKKLAKEGITEARRSVRALRPETLEFNSLPIALQQLINNMTSGTDIKAESIVKGKAELSPEIEVDLYRLAQEAITNTLRHAQATSLTVSLIYQNATVCLQIQDNGIGFDPQQFSNSNFGLMGMQERCDRHNGNLKIDSSPISGTKITATINL